MKGINLGANPEPLLPPQAAGYWTQKGINMLESNKDMIIFFGEEGKIALNDYTNYWL
jgi:hypothetical protein